MIKVALDVRWAQGRAVGGIGRMLRSLIPRLKDRVDVLALADPRRGELPLDVETWALRLPFKAPSALWLELCVPRALGGFDGLFHSPFYLLPRRCPVPAVLSLHDIAFETHPHHFPSVKRLMWRSNVRRAVTRAACILTDTDWGREQIATRYDIPRSSVSVIPLGVEADFQPLADSDVPEWEALLQRLAAKTPYLIALGGPRRRGLPIAIEAWRLLRKRGWPYDLVIVGESTGPRDGAIRVPALSLDREFRLLMAGATFFLYPTEHEGFGLPALEAMASGTPPVCPPVAALPEVLGNGAVWCARDPACLADAIDEVLREQSRLQRTVDAGLRRAKELSWDATADHLASLYERVSAAPRC